MQITKAYLKQLIKEELQNVLNEGKKARVPWEGVRGRLRLLDEEVFEPLNKLLKLGMPIEKFGEKEKFELDQIVRSLQFNMKYLLRYLPRGR
jgi:hypothetical protein